MEAERVNRLPEGVGKRIIEKLRNQELRQESEQQKPECNENYDYGQEEMSNDSSYDSSELYSTCEIEEDSDDSVDYTCVVNAYEAEEEKHAIYNDAILKEQSKPKAKKPQISDVDTLMRLITQLPSGVTKQTGAQIIRQTMEAMGISMNKVLSDAQMAQEDLEHSIRNNINVIEEYKTKIKILEQEILKYKKKAHELEDIISLFILSDKG